MFQFLLLTLVLFTGVAFADDRIIGIWEDEEGLRLDIFDGFKPNQGAVLSVDKDGETRIGSWETTGSETTLQIGWYSASVTFLDDESELFRWSEKIFKKQQGVSEDDIIVLKEDEVGFIDRLTENLWLTSREGRQSVFKSTFSTDSGVVETFSQTGDLEVFNAWGISSGVLKIGDTIIVEARVSKNYMIGQDHSDKFVILQAIRPVSSQGRTDLTKQHSEFLSELTTDIWQVVNYGHYTDHKFRPIEGPFQGRDIRVRNDNLLAAANWEYSPSTGALKIEYSEYVGGLVLGNTLALMDKNGEQVFYRRKLGGSGKTFSVSNVKTHKVNETRGSELANVLSGQFQNREYLYSFEFKDDNRTGFVHKWRSAPFTIAAHKLSNELIMQATETIYAIEDFLLFDDHFILKRDASASRLRPKTEAEVVQDQKSMEEELQDIGRTKLVLRITDTGGKTKDIVLPFATIAEITSIQILQE